MESKLPELPYRYDALVPYIDEKTMEIHHTKHHEVYVRNLNKALSNITTIHKSIEEILYNVSQYPGAIRNNGGGHFNHDFFWPMLTSKSSKSPTGKVACLIERDFGSYHAFQTKFKEASLNRFGAGWAWLCINNAGLLFICSTPNQDNPLMDVVPLADQGMPLLGLDVWEHAYYLTYQNRRSDYIDAFWHIINWDIVNARLQNIQNNRSLR